MLEKKNLILFYPSFEKGGVTNILNNLINSKISKNFKIHVICSKLFFKNAFKKNKNIYFYPVEKKISIPFLHPRYISALNGMIVLSSVINKLKKKVIIHSMQSNVAAIIIAILKKKKLL